MSSDDTPAAVLLSEVSGLLHDGISTSDVVPVETLTTLRATVDTAVVGDDGALVVVGWIYDPQKVVKGFAALSRRTGGLLKKGYAAYHLSADAPGVQVRPAERPDVSAAVGDSGDNHQHGFVLVVPKFSTDCQLALLLDGQRYAVLQVTYIRSMVAAESALHLCMSSSGPQLYSALQSALGDQHALTRTVGDLLINDTQRLRRLSSCDQALLIDDQILLLNGWIGARVREIRWVRVVAQGKVIDLTEKLSRHLRPDLHDAFPRFAEEAMGFLVAVPLNGKQLKQQLELQVSWHRGDRETYRFAPERVGWPELHSHLQRNPALFPVTMRQLSDASRELAKDTLFGARLSKLSEMAFPSIVRTLPNMVEQPERIIVSIDRAFPLGEAGVLVYGWKLTPKQLPTDVTVQDEKGNHVSVKDGFLPVVRLDVVNVYRERFPAAPLRCGFILHIPMPTEPGDARALCFHYAEHGDIWVRVPVDRRDSQGLPLIKEMLGMIPSPGQLHHCLHDIFEGGLGVALEAVNQKRLAKAAATPDVIEVRQFGIPPEDPSCSVIVPLYGRCDFIRHQLAWFADDPDFQNADLIYVIDDPSLVDEAIALAARYQWLFNVSFRIIWYGRNLGFAGANNVGVRFARGKHLLLLNSDVIPQTPGWLNALESQLESLPEAGAVGPLLQFGDGSIQHAGMRPRRDPQLPGFLLNTHPAMGQRWQGGDEPFEQPLLTAACVMLRKTDYDDIGGFDEGYVIGDFEDSDLCLSLRTKGYRLYVVPGVKLWHLERQSQTLNSVADVRQLITLFNGWRYQQKIKQGKLVNPEHYSQSEGESA